MRFLLAQALLAVPLPAQGPLQADVDAAIDRGVELLLRLQNRDGSWDTGPGPDSPHRDPRSGPTALAVYTLLHCGLESEHPSVQRALTYLELGFPDTTYSVGVELLAFGATGDGRWRDRIEDLTERLLEYGTKRGWAYPRHATFPADLSNTQYAALGLRAAAEAGVAVPRRSWELLLEGTLHYQEEERDGAAGFGYALPLVVGKYDAYHGINASMTAAGVATLGIARAALERSLSVSERRRVDAAIARGLAWIEAHWSVTQNPGGLPQWLYYWLYGLERVAAVTGRDAFGGHDWYAEGAAQIVASQAADGSWSASARAEPPARTTGLADTCFALLFLERATARKPTSGARATDTWRAEGPDLDVWLRARGRRPLVVWVSGFAPDVPALYGHDEGAVTGLRVARVEYRVDGAPVQVLDADPGRAWSDERFAHRIELDRAGLHRVSARVAVLDPAPEPGAGELAWLESGTIDVRVDDVLEPWMLEYAAADAENLLRGARLEATASSELSKTWAARHVADGLQFRGWACAAADPAPSLWLELDRPVRANALLLSPLGANEVAAGDFAEVLSAEVHVNGMRAPVVVALPPGGKVLVALGKARRVESVEVRITERAAGARNGLSAGLAEVELVRR